MTYFILSSGFSTFISSALSIWSIVCMWIIFKKAGRKGWEAIIPVWNLYVLFKIADKKGWFWVLLLLPILWMAISVVFWLIMQSGDINEYSDIYSVKSMANWVLGLLALILPLMAWITLPYGLTKKFGQSNWFYIGMLFLTPIFFGILAFGEAKYEGVEFNEKYSLKKWLLVTLGVSLLIGCCDAGVKYKEFKDFDKLYSFNYDYEVGDENNYIKNDIPENVFDEKINEDYDLNEDVLAISDEVKNEIKNNTDSDEMGKPRINYDDIKKNNSGYKPTNKPWIDNIAKDYKGNIIMGSDFVDETKDGFYSVYTKITKRTLYINDDCNFALKIGPENIGYTMEINYNDINEPDTISFLDKTGKKVREMIISSREDCFYISNRNIIKQFGPANNDYFFTLGGNSMPGINILTEFIDEDTFRKLANVHCGIII